MALCENCLKATHNEPLTNGMCKKCYETNRELNDDYKYYEEE